MKNIATSLGLVYLIICSCTSDYNEILPPPDILTFENFEQFSELVKSHSTVDSMSQGNRVKSENTTLQSSLLSLYEKAIEQETLILEKLVLENGENDVLTREQIGWTEFTSNLLESGAIYIDDNGLLEMNVTIPAYAAFVNADGFVKIGSEIYQFKKDYIKVIEDGIIEKASPLKITIKDNIYPVTRNRKVVENAKTQARSSCQNTNDGHRLIAYEEWVGTYLSGGACGYGIELSSYFLTLRSLKSFLGIWSNHKTSYLRSTGRLKIVQQVTCSNEYLPKTVKTIHDDTSEYSRSCPFGHTCNIYFVQNYETGRCANQQYCTPTSEFSIGGLKIITDDHRVYGKEGTTCQLGS